MNKIFNIIKTNFSWKSLLLYMIRWQMSTPILAYITYLFTHKSNAASAAVIANLIGSLIFYWVDLLTFLSNALTHQWEVKEDIVCYDCNNKFKRGYRLVIAPKYNKTKHIPQWRCEKCSLQKTSSLRKVGINV